MKKQRSILFIGFGDIGQRTAARLAGENYSITGFKRSPSHHIDLPKEGCRIVTGDFQQQDDIDRLLKDKEQQEPFDILVLTLTPNEINDTGYRQSYPETVQRVLNTLDYKPELVLFASSTSVYGQSNGEWVNEASPTEPTGFSGKHLLASEQLIEDSGLPYCIVRFSGIYGPGRNRLIEQVQQGKGSPAEPKLYSNRIHAEDAAGFLAHLIKKAETEKIERVYLATDSQPVPLHEVKEWLAKEMGLPPGQLQAETVGRSFRGNKRCRNARVLESGYRFLHPDFRSGYKVLLQQHQKTK